MRSSRRDILKGGLASLATVLAGRAAVAGAQEGLSLAVASNFRGTMPALLAAFREHAGDVGRVRVSYGATGRLYAQIMNGAPHDLFLAADAERPRRLEEAGRAVAGTRMTYAIGRLVLFSRDPALVDPYGEVLLRRDVGPLAIASPRHAPYGRAAMETLRHLGQEEAWQGRLVVGENVAQAFHYVASGAAPLGFVALSGVLESGLSGSQWLVPAAMHAPIRQQAVLLRDKGVARAFLRFLESDAARFIIQQHGYDLPPPRRQAPAAAGE